MKTEKVLDAIEMARWSRGKYLPGLRCHSDAGRQFTSILYGVRLAKIGAVPSIGAVGDSFDNALAETVNGYYKAELVRGPDHPGPWKSVEELELVTLGWVHWHNQERLHGFIGDVPPAELEEAFYAEQRQAQASAGITTLGCLSNPGRSAVKSRVVQFMKIKTAIRSVITAAGFKDTLRALEADLFKTRTRSRTRKMLKSYSSKNALPEKFHFGCGRRKFTGWLNSDMVDSDVDIDLGSRKLPFKDETFNVCLSQHFIEHLWVQSELIPLFHELNRVTKRGGEIWLSCPDIRKCCASYLENDCVDLIRARQARWPDYSTKNLPPSQFMNDIFHQGGEHKNLFDFGLLKAILEGCGFSNIREVDELTLRKRFPEIPERNDGESSLYVSCEKSTGSVS